jgi:hypothetical protein
MLPGSSVGRSFFSLVGNHSEGENDHRFCCHAMFDHVKRVSVHKLRLVTCPEV